MRGKLFLTSLAADTYFGNITKPGWGRALLYALTVLYSGAVPAQKAKDQCNDGNNQYYMYQAAGSVSKSSDSPPDDQDNGYNVK